MNFNLLKIARNAVPLAALLLSACGGSTPASTPGGLFTIGGAISGLSGTVVLQNIGGENLSIVTSNNFVFATVTSNNFVFATKVNDGAPYHVSVRTQPAGQICSVSAGAGTVTGINVNSVVVTCASSSQSHTVGGSVSHLGINPVVLLNNNSDVLTVAANGTFSFATSVASGSPYNVSILMQPSDRRCSVKHGSGTMAGSNISNVSVVCGFLQGGAIQGNPLSLAPTVSTFAGVAGSYANGTGAAARFNGPQASVSDGTNLYVADASNNVIRKIVIATGVVTTLAGSPTGVAGAADGTGTAATFNSPMGITATGLNLYVADSGNNKIRKIVIATGVVSSVTGAANTASAAGAIDGAGTAATFSGLTGITTDISNLYVTDQLNNKIRQIVIATGVVTTLAGSPTGVAGAADGTGTAATFNGPMGITTTGSYLYVTDSNNNKIRQIVIATSVVSSVTGAANTASAAGAIDGAGTAATFSSPYGITTDNTNLYVADSANNKIRQIVIATQAVSSLTGAANVTSIAGKLNGVSGSAAFSGPQGVSYDVASNSLYVADTTNNDLRQITLGASSIVSTLAGKMGPDGTGVVATFNNPQGTTTDGTNLYVADTTNGTIRKIVIATGAVTTLAGQTGVNGAADGFGTAATFNSPNGITTDGTRLYVADSTNGTIRKIVIATGAVTTLAGQTGVSGAADGTGTAATFNIPMDITTDGTNLYVVEQGNNKIRQIVIATGVVTSVTGTANTAVVAGVADGGGATAAFNWPSGITTDGTNLYVADRNNNKIRQIVIATGVVSSVTGAANTASAAGAIDGAGTAATFSGLTGITTDGTNLYVADTSNYKIRQIVIATGVVTSLTGAANTTTAAGAADGAGTTATFSFPQGITTDGSSLYVVDMFSSTIRKIQ